MFTLGHSGKLFIKWLLGVNNLMSAITAYVHFVGFCTFFFDVVAKGNSVNTIYLSNKIKK